MLSSRLSDKRRQHGRDKQGASNHGRDYSGGMRSVIALGVALFLAGSAMAHERFTIVGSVAGLKQDEIAVKAIDGATYEIDMNDGSVVTDKHHKKVDRSHLKVGVNVVVLAMGHDMFDLEAFEIQLVDR